MLHRKRTLQRLSRLSTVFFLIICLGKISVGSEFVFSVKSQQWKHRIVPELDRSSQSFVLEFAIDPVAAQGGDVQVVAGVVIGGDGAVNSAKQWDGPLKLQIREGAGRANYDLVHRGMLLSKVIPSPKPAGWTGPNSDYQHPTALPMRDGEGYRVKIAVWPSGEGSRLRVYVEHDDRPVEEHQLQERLSAGAIAFFAMRGGQDQELSRQCRIRLLRAESVEPSEAASRPSISDCVLDALDLSHPSMASVADAISNGDRESAKQHLLAHLRSRVHPRGPTLLEAQDTALHPDWQRIADEVLQGRYGTQGYFAGITDQWTDTTGVTHRWEIQNDPLELNWARCNGHLNRHFHWVSLAKAFEQTNDPRYVRRFSAEVIDWVTREPFYWDQCPTVGGINLMDGTVFRWGYMNTSNIGRRLELTWWPAYEVFRKSPDFSDEAHFCILIGMLRQARLIMNPSSFAPHDDGGAHTTLALIQTALLLPEFAESARWKETAQRRWDTMIEAQFHPDGTHVSLSTGYSWASVATLENYLRLTQRLGGDMPDHALRILERAYEHAMLLSTPSQSNIDLNDGGWGL
ncbi:MAG: heparinase II/III family protein, partial [Planctomycetota bacterium]